MSNASLELGGDNWAAKDGNLLGYAVGDSSGKYVPREFTFTRGSNLAATRIAANGLIEKGRENLLLQSNQFDTTWTLSSTSVTSGQAGYDGSSDAWLLNSTTTGFPRIAQNVSSSGVATYSVYAKPATDGFILMRTFGADSSVWFDLTNGTIPNAAGSQYITSNIQSVGNGWYRCSVIVNGSLTSLRIYPASAYGVYSTSGNGVYIQDAQLEQGLVATDYIETGATTVQAGLLENEPRIDYTGGTGSLLLEPSRTNLITQSEYKASGDFTNSTPSYNAASSLEGLQNATEMFDDSTNGQHRVPIGSFAVTSGTDYTISAFVKNNDIGYCYLLLEGGFTQTRYYFNLSTGQPITSGLEVENFADGWYRIYVTQSAAASGTGSVYLNMSNNGVSPIYVGSNQSLYFYGLQAEQGSYPTSYIPNHSGGSVTRAADAATKEYSDNFNDITIFAEVNSEDVVRDGSAQNIQIGNDFSQGGAFFLRRSSNTSPKRFAAFFLNNDNTSVFSSYELPEDNSKVAFKYNSTSNACKLFVNGSEVRSATATDITEFDTFRLNGNGGKFNSKQLVVFNTELSDADCITLTT